VEKETKTLQTPDAARCRYLWTQKTAIKQEKKKQEETKKLLETYLPYPGFWSSHCQ